MTQTAWIIAQMEAAPPEERAAIQARYPVDTVFRDVLALTYDPYEQFGTPWGLEDPAPIENPGDIDACLDDLWFYAGLSADLRSGLTYEQVVSDWRQHDIWPVLERVLRKRFVGVTFAMANSVWGTFPLFDAGDVSDGPVRFPCRAVVIPSRHRRLVVARPVTYLPDGAARVDVFDRDGVCYAPVLGEVLPRKFRRVPWAEVFATPGCDVGVVLDGFVNDAQEEFHVFDAVGLRAFKEQKLTPGFMDRHQILEPLVRDQSYSYDVKVLLAPAIEDAGHWARVRFTTPFRSSFGVVGIDPDAPYPYRATHAWRWLQAPGG